MVSGKFLERPCKMSMKNVYEVEKLLQALLSTLLHLLGGFGCPSTPSRLLC